MRQRAIEGIRVGDAFTVTRVFSEAEVEAFGRLTGDRNPVHSDPAFARLKGFRRTACHGLLTGALVTEIGGQIGWLATRLDFSFLKPVYPGDSVTCVATVVSTAANGFARAEAVARNQQGTEVLRAVLEGFLPADKERDRLAAIAASDS